MHLFVQIEKGQKLLFYTSSYNLTYTLEYNIKIENIFIDNDNILYGFSQGVLYKLTEVAIPLYYDISLISNHTPIFFIATNHLISMKNDTNFQILKRMPEGVKGVCHFGSSYLFWEERKICLDGNVIDLNFCVRNIKVVKNLIFILGDNNIFYIYKEHLLVEIMDLRECDVLDFCVNEFLPVVAFLSSENIYILDTDNKKIVKVIDSYGGKNILFKSKRELFIIGDKVVEYHLGKDSTSILFKEATESVFKCFELKTEFKIETDTFKEEVRSKLIENKIENKRMLFKLMNEIDELRSKIAKN